MKRIQLLLTIMLFLFPGNQSFGQDGENGLKITSIKEFCMQAQYFEHEDYGNTIKKQARHQYDMKKRDYIVLNIDYGMMGVGGDTSWGATPHLIYQLLRREYSWSYIIEPF